MSSLVSIPSLAPTFQEKWFAGTYVVSGTFYFEAHGVNSDTIMAHVGSLYREVIRAKKAPWPRGLAGFFLIPIFCGSGFSDEVRMWVRTRHPCGWAIWLEPLLYDVSQNTVALREDYQLFGRAFFPYLNQLFVAGLSTAALHFGHASPPQRKNA